MDYLELARRVGEITRRAGAEILKIYDSEDLGVETKADDSPLTRADRAANDLIVRELEQLDFQAPIVSEEGRDVPFSERAQYTRFWLVDPLDGTKEFIKRNGEFTVNVALIESEKPMLGAVYVPVTDQLYYAATGSGAHSGDGQRLTVTPFTLQNPRLRVVASRSHLNDATQAFLDGLNDPEIVTKGSSLKIIEVASGAAHLYPRLAPTMEWDTAAAHAILLEAGGRLVDEGTGKEMRYNKEVLRNPGFVVYGGVLEGQLSC